MNCSILRFWYNYLLLEITFRKTISFSNEVASSTQENTACETAVIASISFSRHKTLPFDLFIYFLIAVWKDL